MRRAYRIIFIGTGAMVLASLVAGCAGARPAVSQDVRGGDTDDRHVQARAATTQSATLAQLDAMIPEPEFPPSRSTPTTQPAPLDAIELYAEGRAAIEGGDGAKAVIALEKAIKLDPDSFALRYALAEAHVRQGSEREIIIAALKEAEKLAPRHLELRTELGRQYLGAGDLDNAILQLRLARMTADYESDDELATIADYMLARAYQLKGYDRAALEMYQQLIGRLRNSNLAIRGNRDLFLLAQAPEALFVQMAELSERLGDISQAASFREVAADRQPQNLDYQAKLIRALTASGRTEDARKRAAEVVNRFRASPESLRLLREAYRGTGADAKSQSAADAAVIVELRRLVKENPDDRPLVFALVEMLAAQNRISEATSFLLNAAQAADYDIEYVRRLFAMYKEQPDTVDQTARLLIEAHAARPDAQDELAPLWSDLMRRRWTDRIRIARLQAIEVSAGAEAAKLFWVAQLAQSWNRDLLARSSLEQSAAQSPPFAPTYRLLIGRFWMRDDWDEARKTAESEALIKAARSAGNSALAYELQGLLELRRNQPGKALEALTKSVEAGATSPQVRIAQAAALFRAGAPTRAEQLLWALIEERPFFEEAYNSLFQYYYQTGASGPAMKVLRAWRTADPANVNGRLLEAVVLMQARQFGAAEQLLLQLFTGHPDNPDVLTALRSIYVNTNRTEELINKLQAERRRDPGNRVALEYLIDIYVNQKRTDDAVRVLDEVRAAVAGDADLLYYVAHLYTRVGREKTTEQILAEVVRLDPAHAPASNDLGYSWADQGRNMEQAERLIRVALDAEPDNQSYLDSLGWVLYKRSKFEEAVARLEQAIAPATFPDPVVLDHLGDALYRLSRKDQARHQWQRAQDQLPADPSDDTRTDIRALRSSLKQKLADYQAGKAVTVAPVVEGPENTKQQVKK